MPMAKKRSNKASKLLVAQMEAKSQTISEHAIEPSENKQVIEESEEISQKTKELFQTYDVPPDEFIEKRDESEEELFKVRKRLIYARSIESCVGYSSLLRLLSNAYIEQVAYYRSEEGGLLPIEEARARAYRPCENEEEANGLFDQMMSVPVDWINMQDLLSLIGYAPRG